MALKAIRRRGQCAVMARCAIISLCASAFFAGTSDAGISFDSTSNVKIAHYAEENNAGTSGIVNLVPPSSGSMPVPSTYQYKKTLNLNGGSSSASASIGEISNSQNVGFTFASGTGITQSDPGLAFAGPALLRFDLNGIWNVTSGGYGPISYGYCALTVAGNIPAGDTASIQFNMTWKDENGVSLRPAFSQTYNYNSGSTLPTSITNTGSLNGGAQIASGKKIKIGGSIYFRASDPGATIDLHPVDFEMSAAPPTYRYQDKTGNFGFDGNWLYEMGSLDALGNPIQFIAPNGPGVRALIASSATGNTTTTLDVTQGTTLGVLDIDRPGVTLAAGGGTVTFDTMNGNAVLFLRNVQNFQQGVVNTTIQAPIVLNKPLEVQVDTVGSLNSTGPISGTGGIVKNGLGNLVLNSPNSFTGGIIVNGGTITAMVPGSLGSNTVNLNGGMIDVQTPNPFSGAGGTIAVGSNSQVNVGAIGGNVNYNVASLGAISGSSSQLQSLIIGSNFFPAPGAMIAHQTFSPTIATGNPGGLTNVPTYIFGISNNFTSAGQSIIVGTLSGSPWQGFGSDQSPHTFGGGAGQTLGISGQAHLVALGGALTINCPITGTAADMIKKNGAGLVIINSAANTFSGQMEVQTGPISMNAGWQGPITIDAGATLGGTGNLASNLTFLNDASNTSGGIFKPGTLGPIASSPSSPQTIEGPGTLQTTGNVSFSGLSHLVYDLNTSGVVGGVDNDLLKITGNLTLDGILDIHGGPEFTTGVYTLMTFTGTLTDNGLTLGTVPLDDFPGMQVVIQNNAGGTGGSVLLAVPEPGTIGLLATIGTAMFVKRRRC